jgi:hypothetical protein
VPSAADALVLACVHRAAHHHDTRNLLWLYDIHLLAQGLSDEDWARVLSTARHGAVAALCARGLALAAVCFGTRVPDATAAALAAPTKEASRLFLADDVRPVARLASDLRALGSRDGVRLLREIAFPPRTYMRAAYGGTGWLPWLYVRRVGRGVGKWMRPFRSVGC